MRRTLTDPMDDLLDLKGRLYRLLDESFTFAQAESAPSFSPPVDILASGEEVVILVELPGMSRDEVIVEVNGAIVTISGERKPEQGGAYYVRERPAGSFRRSFSLAWELDPDSVSASLDDGLLQVTVRRRDGAREIGVGHEQEGQ